MALTPKRLFLSFSLSSCLPLFSAFFSRAHYWVNKYILKNACELKRVVLYFKGLSFWLVSGFRNTFAVHITFHTDSDKWKTLKKTPLSTRSTVYIQSLLAAGAVWLNLGPPRQPEGRRPEGCRGGPRCSQTAPATRRDCVYHHGTDTRLEQVKLEKIELEKKAF